MDRFPREVRSRIMSRIRSESGIEALPQWLLGLYMRKHPRGIFGNPDFGSKAKRIAVFIDGCFWHKCPIHYREPKSNIEFWRAKIEGNTARDRLVTETLIADGWRVYRIWECELGG